MTRVVPLPGRRPPLWPDDLLSVDDLDSWTPLPFRQFVVKLHSRCNLACDYCYLYEMADSSWRGRPGVMDSKIVEATAQRVAEHVATHGLDRVHVVLHGGEPLLAGTRTIAHAAEALRERMPSGTELAMSVQTNGVLLDEAMLDVLAAHRIRVGVSLDGDAPANDRHRRFTDGRGSHDAVARALVRLRGERYRGLYAGLLCTIDVRNDPVAVYEGLLEHAPPTVDFLLPHGNWTEPPPGWTDEPGAAPYADWLAAVFDRWYDAPQRETSVRIFEDLMGLLIDPAHQSRSEQVGLAPAVVVVVDTDGSIEQVDTLRSAFDGAAGTGFSVLTDPFDDVLRHPSLVARQLGLSALAEPCQDCRFARACGGGYYPHRFRADHGFRNPSVYCRDLMRLIEHIRSRVAADIARLPKART
ncbi:FxsB family radical SAM/SPASM domain protein [Streptomycetaceae bacterium NBC_01309]